MKSNLAKGWPLVETGTVIYTSGQPVYRIQHHDIPGAIATVVMSPSDAEMLRKVVWERIRDAQAEAFDQGQKSGVRHADRVRAAGEIGRTDLPGTISPNPYRT